MHLNNLIQQRKFCYLLRESQSIASSGVRNSLSSSPASLSLISILLWYFYFSHILHTVCFIVQQYSKAENNAVKCSLKSYLIRAVAEQLLVVVGKKKKDGICVPRHSIFYIKIPGKPSYVATNTETALAEVSSDSLGNVKEKKKKQVQILTLVLRSHKFCAFLTVPYISAASKPESLAFFWGWKLRVSQGILSWLPPEPGCSSSS